MILWISLIGIVLFVSYKGAKRMPGTHAVISKKHHHDGREPEKAWSLEE